MKTFSESGERKYMCFCARHKHSGISEPLEEYLHHLRRKKYSPATLVSYGGALDKFLAFITQEHGRERIQDVVEKDIDLYRARLIMDEYSPRSIELHMRSIRQFFNWLEAQQKLFVNPARHLIVRKPDRPLKPVPTEEEMKQLLAQPNVSTPIGLRDRAVLEMFYSCGLRREELLSLTIYDPDVRQGMLRVIGKGRKERVVPLGKQAVHWLKQYLQYGRPKLVKSHIDQESLWLTREGDPLAEGSLAMALKKYVASSGIKTHVSPHTLRRACATHMLRGGAHPVQLQMLLGHSTMVTLSQYLRVTITDLKSMHKRSKPGR
jgi:integrase/recombinase XerD